MAGQLRIAGYCRISVDEELDRENTSIENQKSIILDYVSRRFPGSKPDFYEDRDRSGYTFDQREGYQKLRPQLMSGRYDILVVKDFSRFSRRNSRGLVELEDLRDAGVRILSIGDSIDYPTNDDWTAIQFRFLINEMPVTDASKKVRSVISRRQADGRWICAVPYGYVITNSRTMAFRPEPAEAQVVRRIFELYNEGWGYKRISNYLTEQHIPTPRMSERERKLSAGGEYNRTVKEAWNPVTIQGILHNDFYIGTLRQGKYTRKKINGTDHKTDDSDHIVFENHHDPIVDFRVFSAAQDAMKTRSRSNYRGVKKYDNFYSGVLFCGDCGSPMFSMSRADLKPAYTCGAYHRRGLAGCTSHHIRTDLLDELLKRYLRKVRDNSASMLDELNSKLKMETDDIRHSEETGTLLERQLDDAYRELKATKRMRIRELMNHPEREPLLDQTYDDLEAELENRITGLQNQIELNTNRRSTIIQTVRTARTALTIFDNILEKDKLDKLDISFILEKIFVCEDHIDIRLKADIDTLLRCGPEDLAEAEQQAPEELIQKTPKHPDKIYCTNVISDGDPLEIYTDKDGEVIFKKYSPMGELSEFAASICETLSKTTGRIAAVSDRDAIIAVSGVSRRELLDKPNSPELERIMEERQVYQYTAGDSRISAVEGVEKYALGVAAPIISEGDLMGCVMFLIHDGDQPLGETEYKLAQTVAGFLGKQMES